MKLEFSFYSKTPAVAVLNMQQEKKSCYFQEKKKEKMKRENKAGVFWLTEFVYFNQNSSKKLSPSTSAEL